MQLCNPAPSHACTENMPFITISFPCNFLTIKPKISRRYPEDTPKIAHRGKCHLLRF